MSLGHLCHKHSETATKTLPTSTAHGGGGLGLESVMEERTEGGGWRRGLALTSLSHSLIQFGPSKRHLGLYFLTATCDSNYCQRFPFKPAFYFGRGGGGLDCLGRTRLPHPSATGALSKLPLPLFFFSFLAPFVQWVVVTLLSSCCVKGFHT